MNTKTFNFWPKDTSFSEKDPYSSINGNLNNAYAWGRYLLVMNKFIDVFYFKSENGKKVYQVSRNS